MHGPAVAHGWTSTFHCCPIGELFIVSLHHMELCWVVLIRICVYNDACQRVHITISMSDTHERQWVAFNQAKIHIFCLKCAVYKLIIRSDFPCEVEAWLATCMPCLEPISSISGGRQQSGIPRQKWIFTEDENVRQLLLELWSYHFSY